MEDTYTKKLELEKNRHTQLDKELSELRKAVQEYKDTHMNPSDTSSMISPL